MPQYSLEIDKEYLRKWQAMLDIVARIAAIPAALIMRVVEGSIEVFAASGNGDNPYRPGERAILEDSGLYCETTIRSDRTLLVPNAAKDPAWRNNPDMLLNMVSYLGLPIRYPDRRTFGTICVLDRKENGYSPLIEELLTSFRDAIEADLLLMANNRKLELLLREVHHRVKNNIVAIEAFLRMQATMTGNAEAREVLQRAVGRVEYMEIVYKRLLVEDSYEQVSLKAYVEDLVAAIMRLLAPEDGRIGLELRVEELRVDASLATGVGLIVNELVTNALKYAFPDTRRGTVEVRLSKQAEGYELVVADDGIGMSADRAAEQGGGFGLTIVKMAAEQIRATLSVSASAGTCYRLAWKAGAA